jgi:hypothetical protein
VVRCQTFCIVSVEKVKAACNIATILALVQLKDIEQQNLKLWAFCQLSLLCPSERWFAAAGQALSKVQDCLNLSTLSASSIEKQGLRHKRSIR